MKEDWSKRGVIDKLVEYSRKYISNHYNTDNYRYFITAAEAVFKDDPLKKQHLNLLEESIRSAKKIKTKYEKMDAFIDLALLARFFNENSIADTLLKKAYQFFLDWYADQNWISFKVGNLIRIAEAYILLNQNTVSEELLKSAESNIDKIELSLSDKSHQLGSLAISYFNMGNKKKANLSFVNSINILNKPNVNLYNKCYGFLHLSGVLKRISMVRQSEKILNKARDYLKDYLRQEKNIEYKCSFLISISKVYYKFGEISKALKLLESSFKLALKIRPTEDEPWLDENKFDLLTEIGYLFIKLKDEKKALAVVEKIDIITSDEDWQIRDFLSEASYGSIKFLLGYTEESIDIFNKLPLLGQVKMLDRIVDQYLISG